MIGMLQSLAGRMRRVFASAAGEGAALRNRIARRPGAALLRRKRAKVALMAILFGVFSGVTELPLPAEDLYRAARGQILRLRPVPQDIVFIAVDSESVTKLGGKHPKREHYSRVVETLFAAGVTRIAFDSAQADPETPEADAAFEQTLARHRGKVMLGMVPEHRIGSQLFPALLPLSRFQDHARLAAMNGLASPFGLSTTFNTEVESNGQAYPAISAALAGYRGASVLYRPDYAYDVGTIPTVSFLDVYTGKVSADQLKGKAAIIGHANFATADYFLLPFSSQDMVPGAYLHIMGAHTLKKGVPFDLYWYPGLLIASLVIASHVVSRSRSQRMVIIFALGLVVAPVVFDEVGMNLDVMPALMALVFAGIGFYRINRKYYSSDVDAMTTSAISSDKPSEARDVYALKIANLAELSEEWSVREIGDFVNTLISYVKGPGEIGDVAFERDLLVWLAPRMDTVELERHADGLALMLKTAISYDWQSSNGAPALGIDTNHDLPVAVRIKKAMQAADEAANRGVRFIINDAAHLEARNNRLHLIRILEKGLRNRDVGVAYQPKIDLASGRIVGAETLIRWQAEGEEYINPQDLVLAAEAADRINELTLVVMEAALIDGKRAIALDPRFKLAVNMSAKSLSDTHLLFDIMTLLGRYDFPAENLTLELTETAKLEDHRIAPQVAALKARGIGLSIDDFGTGQSNLEYIEKLPSSELKIDKKFVQHMASSDESLAVVRATIEIAHSLGKLVVAEGVEDVGTAATLRAMGCDQAQGFLFSRAIAMDELLGMMGGGRSAING